MHHKFKNLSGQTFGALTALRPTTSVHGKWRWLFRCTCGRETEAEGRRVARELARGGTPNCGCLTKQLIAEKNRTHGLSKHPAYAVYRSMLARCYRETHPAWLNYGARGITVCTRWRKGFAQFWEDMGPTYQPGLTLDRIDNNGPYGPKNCRWADWYAQCANKRTSLPVNLSELARRTGIGVTTLAYRWKRGKRGAELTAPPDSKKSRSGTF